MKKTLLFLFFFANFAMLNLHCIWAAGPNSISYQGRLRESGQPVSGARNFNFKLFTEATVGTQIWTSGDIAVLVSSGIYSTQIGNDNLKNLDFANNDYWLEISVGGNAFTPREKISAVPYAFTASTATNLMGAGNIRLSGSSGNHWILNGNVGIGITNPSTKLDVYSTDASGNMGDLMLVRDGGGRIIRIGVGRGSNANMPEQAAYIAKSWSDSATGGLVIFSGGGTPNTGGIQFYTGPTGAETEAMKISRAGNVGIGATVPAAALHISTGAVSGGYRLLVTTGTGTQTKDVFTVSNNGSVGIGTTNPAAALDVRGSIKLNSDGALYAPGGVENLRMIRGSINADGTVLAGSGFTCSRATTGQYTITFTSAFNAEPTVTLGGFGIVSSATLPISLAAKSATAFAVRITDPISSYYIDSRWEFIAIGPR